MYGRRTNRLTGRLVELALALGGKPAQRVAGKLNLKVGRSTLIRLLEHYQLPTYPTPRLLGVDDFALRRGQVYATLLVDLEKHQPIDVLADRSSETFGEWLVEHSGIEIISRDRDTAYALAANKYASGATQVADRFHILVRRIGIC